MTRLLDGMPYTPAAKMGPDYLRERFRQIREQQEREQIERGRIVPEDDNEQQEDA